MKKLLISLVVIMMAGLLSAATIWSEDFTGQNGKGAVGPTPTIDTDAVPWNVDVSNASLTATSDWFMVVNEEFSGQDVDGTQQANGTGQGPVWYSDPIDISSYSNIGISLDVAASGSFENQDFIKASYQIDGGAITQFGFDYEPDGLSTSYSVSGLGGNSLVVYVELDNNAGSEVITFDNVLVTGDLGSSPYCTIAPIGSQSIWTGQDGTELTVSETANGDTFVSRDWGYRNVSEGAITSLGVSTTTYTPNFATAGTYYVVCSTTWATEGATVSNEVTVVVAEAPSIPFSEDFDGASWGDYMGWTYADFTISSTSYAGGSPNEVALSYSNDNPGASHITTPPIDASGFSNLQVQWLNDSNYYNDGEFTIELRTSTDGSDFSNVAWSETVTADETAAKTVNLDAADGAGSSTLYLRWFYAAMSGNSFSFWNIDEISVTEATSVPAPGNLDVIGPADSFFDITYDIPGGEFEVDWDGILFFVMEGNAEPDLSGLGAPSAITGNNAYGNGTLVEDAEGEYEGYCVDNVQNDAGLDITVTSLSSNTTYYVFAYAYGGATYSAVATASGTTYMSGLETIYINEICADNDAFNQDEAGDNDDWLELYNPTGSPVDISGWYLTDDEGNPGKWQIPATTTIAAGGFLLVWCDDEAGEGAYHASFSLSAGGEFTGLYGPDGYTPVDTHTYGSMNTDWSEARDTDGSASWVTHTIPTPDASNNTSELLVVAPNGGESWAQNSGHGIIWNTRHVNDATVNIELLSGGTRDSRATTIDATAPNTGVYTWDIGMTPTGTDYTIRITATSANDVSDAAFTITGEAPEDNSDVVINEIMYNPLESGTDYHEYIELYNNGTGPAFMDNWSFSSGVTFTFPGGTTLAAGDYMVIAVNAASFTTQYGFAPDFQWDSGGLSNGGEKVELSDATRAVIDVVDYDDGSGWPTSPDEGGPSLERIDPNLPFDVNNAAASLQDWGTPGSQNQYDNSPTPPADGGNQDYGTLPGGSGDPVFNIADAAGGGSVTLTEYSIVGGQMHPQLGPGDTGLPGYLDMNWATDNATLTMYYTQADFDASGIASEEMLRIAAWDGGAWTMYPRGAGSDTALNIVTAENLNVAVRANVDYVMVSDDSTLPVELSTFAATVNATGFVQLQWETHSEIDFNGFNLFRSGNNDVNSAIRLNSMIISGQGSASSGSVYDWTDQEVATGQTYYYWLESCDLDGTSGFYGPVSVTLGEGGEGGDTPEVVLVTELYDNYPNPFNPMTTISFYLAEDADVTLRVYNITGQHVKTLIKGQAMASAQHTVSWNGTDDQGHPVGSGVFFYRLNAGDKTFVKKMVLMK